MFLFLLLFWGPIQLRAWGLIPTCVCVCVCVVTEDQILAFCMQSMYSSPLGYLPSLQTCIFQGLFFFFFLAEFDNEAIVLWFFLDYF